MQNKPATVTATPDVSSVLSTDSIPLADWLTLSLRYQVIPLQFDEQTIYLGVSEQSDREAVSVFRFATGKAVITQYWDPQRLQKALLQLQIQPNLEQLQRLITDKVATEHSYPTTIPIESVASLENEPLVRFIDDTLQQAINQQASDIHFEPGAEHYRVRFRIDGLLQMNPHTPPVALAARIAARLKIISGLNIAECRLPQDGQLMLQLPHNSQKISLRISTLLTRWGEKVVLRLLDNQQPLLTLTQLGMPFAIEQQYRQALGAPQGLVLVTGPTGSGKTITLYSGLQLINRPEINICTVEDPIEISLPGINQLQIHPKIGLTFERSLRGILRQDPDVLMIGEIRDRETALIAIKAAQTGHLVLATLHTNSAVAAITRLLQLGVARYPLASVLHLVIAQRLLRKCCQSCHGLRQIVSNACQQSKTLTDEPHACPDCHQGYQGRVAIYQALGITPEITEAILQNANETVLKRLAQQQGMQALSVTAQQLIQQGITTPEEQQRVLGQSD
ncbi:MAG: GspE/PulE family protein [Candidatus Symbiodolus clandestinus]